VTLDVVNSSIGSAAVNIVILAFPLDTGPRDSPGYIAMYFALGGLGGLAGSFAGGYLAELFHGVNLELFGYHIYGLQLFLIVGGLMRLGAVPLFLRVRTAKYVGLPTVALNVLALVARRSPVRLFKNSRPIPREHPNAPSGNASPAKDHEATPGRATR
jgi:MFS family permease